jgi:hypothetical protein
MSTCLKGRISDPAIFHWRDLDGHRDFCQNLSLRAIAVLMDVGLRARFQNKQFIPVGIEPSAIDGRSRSVSVGGRSRSRSPVSATGP